jgi:hypothetical protein
LPFRAWWKQRALNSKPVAWSPGIIFRSALDPFDLLLLLHSLVSQANGQGIAGSPSWRTPKIMAILGGTIGYRLLRWISPRCKDDGAGWDDGAYQHISKLEALFGPTIWDEVRGKIVVDFGCGVGTEAVKTARRSAAHVIGVDPPFRLRN